jgi:hypothetical protein
MNCANFDQKTGYVMMRLLNSALFLAVFISGCATPFIEYEHLDATPFESGTNDAYNLACGGLEVGERFSAEASYCKNVSSAKGEFLKASVRWRIW